VSEEFVHPLDRTGVVCAVIHWVNELTNGPSAPGAESRLTRLLGRLS